MLNYLRAVGVGLDVFLNAIFGGCHDYETISARLGKNMPDCLLCSFLSLFQSDHCRKAYQDYLKIVAALQGS